jgi:uncharacterized membrane-anchored protein
MAALRLKSVLTGMVIGLLAASVPAFADDGAEKDRSAEFKRLPWLKGPSEAPVGQRARIKIPDETGLLPESSGAKFLELTGNLPSPGHTILAHGNWWATFVFQESGYIKDDEKLDADKLLSELKSQDSESNQERRKRGFPELNTEGWIVPPHYDSESKQLEWGLKLRASGNPEPIVNYTMRVLGRHGYESVVLVTSPQDLDHDVKELRGILKSFDYNAGEKYSEFRAGDHVAEFGLGALVVGGAAAAAIKGGWFKGLLAALVAGWKLVAGLVVAAVAGVGKLFGRKQTR